MAEMKSPFDRLPREMQRHLMSYLNKGDILVFRQVSKGCHAVVAQREEPFTFDKCILSDATAPFVLKSEESVRKLWVSNFLQSPQVGISSSRGTILGRISELILGTQISPKNMASILEYVDSIEGLGFESPDRMVLESFFTSKGHYDFVTKLSLNVMMDIEIRDDYVTLFYTLAASFHFPGLKHLIVNWNGPHDRQRDLTPVEGARAYSMYVSIHKMLIRHSKSIKIVSWNLNGFRVTGQVIVRLFYDTIEEYRSLRTQLSSLVQLKEIHLKKTEAEGSNYNDLTNSLLIGQRNLEILEYMVPHAQPMNLPNFAPISTILRNSKLTIQEVKLDCPVFAFFWLDGCINLKKLTLTSWHFATTPINSLPRSITEIDLDVKYLFTEEATTMIRWMKDNLIELRVMKLSFKLLFASAAAFPNPELFKEIFKPPKLEFIRLTYKCESGTENYLVRIKLKRMMVLCRGRKGLRTKRTVTIEKVDLKYVTKYKMEFFIDRQIFKGF